MSRRDSSESEQPARLGEGVSPSPADPQLGRALDVLQRIAPEAKFSFSSPDDPVQLAHSRDMEQMKERHRERVELVGVSSAVAGTILTLAGLGILIWLIPNNDFRKAALTPLTAIFTAWLGFLAGRASGKPGA